MVVMELAVWFFRECEQLFPLEFVNYDSLEGTAGSLKRRIPDFQGGPLGGLRAGGVMAAGVMLLTSRHRSAGTCVSW